MKRAFLLLSMLLLGNPAIAKGPDSVNSSSTKPAASEAGARSPSGSGGGGSGGARTRHGRRHHGM